MSRFILSAGMVWVILCFIIGVLLVATKPTQIIIQNGEQKVVSKPDPITLNQGNRNAAPTSAFIAGTPTEEVDKAKTSAVIK